MPSGEGLEGKAAEGGTARLWGFSGRGLLVGREHHRRPLSGHGQVDGRVGRERCIASCQGVKFGGTPNSDAALWNPG